MVSEASVPSGSEDFGVVLFPAVSVTSGLTGVEGVAVVDTIRRGPVRFLHLHHPPTELPRPSANRCHSAVRVAVPIHRLEAERRVDRRASVAQRRAEAPGLLMRDGCSILQLLRDGGRSLLLLVDGLGGVRQALHGLTAAPLARHTHRVAAAVQ